MKEPWGFYASELSFPLFAMWFLWDGRYQGLMACLLGFALGLGTTMAIALWERSKKNAPERMVSGSKVKIRAR